MPRYQQGYFKPKHPEKYIGNPTKIIYRSSWELTAMRKFDTNPNILAWQSEEFFIGYRSPLDRKVHRYFPDFRIKKIGRDGKVSTVVIEIKPHEQTYKPMLSEGKKPNKAYYRRWTTYLVNEAKWEAAQAYCKKRGWGFEIITERHLFNTR